MGSVKTVKRLMRIFQAVGDYQTEIARGAEGGVSICFGKIIFTFLESASFFGM